MGDAVMAFFGGKNINTFNAIIDGINCSSVINAFYQTIIIPKLGYEDTTNEGIRIGLDYGSKDSVHWSSYGYPGANEVTATGFNIDVASKLQNSAGKNNIMIGQKLKEHIDFPDELLSIKKVKRDGQEIEEPYIKPNYTDVKGNSINYKKYLLNWKDFLFTTNIGQLERTKLTDKNISVPEIRSEGIPVTYVPARNTIFLSYALAWAEVLAANDIFIGVNAVDYSGYPDCRPEFINAYEEMANLATKAGVVGNRLTIHTPLIDLTKADIISEGTALGVDYAMTVSCYQADDGGRACGVCDSCRIRADGFKAAGVSDPTRYKSD